MRAVLLSALLAAAPAVEMEHEAVREVEPGMDLRVAVHIRAAAGVYMPMLHWRPASATSYRKVPLQVAGEDLYEGVIPAQELGDEVEYFLEAYDLKLGGPARSGSPAQPHRVRVLREGTLRVTSETAGASIEVDGTALGTGMFAGRLGVGPHSLRVHLQGRRPFALDFTMPQGQDLDIHVPILAPEPEPARAAEPAPLAARLKVETDPPGAAIALDGREVGRAPFQGEIPAGTHALAARLPRYLEAEETFSAGPGAQVERRLQLRPLPPPWWAWGAAAGSAVAGAAAVVAWLLGRSAFDDYSTRFDAQGVRDQGTLDRANVYAAGSLGLAVTATLAAAVAAYAFWWPSAGDERARPPRPQ